MEAKTVEKLEKRVEEAIAGVVVKMGLKQLPLLPARRTLHLMAKAAVTVYEAAADSRTTRPRRTELPIQLGTS